MGDVKIDEYAVDTYLTELFFERSDCAVREADKRYHNLIFSVILTILGVREDAEECLNDVYMKIWNSIPPNRPISFRAYAVKIARNTAISIMREKKAKKRVPDGVIESFDNLGDGICKKIDNDAEASREIREIINAYLASVDERKMYIFMSRYYFSKPIKEIARTLKCSQSTIDKEIKKIKAELRERLEEGGVSV